MTGLPLDSHALLWWALEPAKISRAATQALRSEDRLLLSVASIWELEIKAALKKLEFPEDLWGDLPELGVEIVAISALDAITAGRLPRHHDDPFDRMIVAQAVTRGFTIVTHDSKFVRYGAPIVKA